jgi:hypothetical protein
VAACLQHRKGRRAESVKPSDLDTFLIEVIQIRSARSVPRSWTRKDGRQWRKTSDRQTLMNCGDHWVGRWQFSGKPFLMGAVSCHRGGRNRLLTGNTG